MAKISETLMTRTIQELIQKMIPLSIFGKIAKAQEIACKDCVNTYRKFIRALAKKFISSPREAEAATHELFADIWQYAKTSNSPPSAEEVLDAQAAHRRLIKVLR